MDIEEKKNQVVGAVAKELMSLNVENVDYVPQHEDVFKCQGFLTRIRATGMKLYLGMLENGGALPGKKDIAAAIKLFVGGMTTEQIAIFSMCVYEASCSAELEYRMMGKMNGKLGQAAADPKNVPENSN